MSLKRTSESSELSSKRYKIEHKPLSAKYVNLMNERARIGIPEVESKLTQLSENEVIKPPKIPIEYYQKKYEMAKAQNEHLKNLYKDPNMPDSLELTTARSNLEISQEIYKDKYNKYLDYKMDKATSLDNLWNFAKTDEFIRSRPLLKGIDEESTQKVSMTPHSRFYLTPQSHLPFKPHLSTSVIARQNIAKKKYFQKNKKKFII